MDAAVVAAIVTAVGAILGGIATAIIQPRSRSQPTLVALRPGRGTVPSHRVSRSTAPAHGAISANLLADYHARMWRISQLLDEIETIRAVDMDTLGSATTARRLSSLRGRLRTLWKGVEAACGPLLSVIATRSEIKSWKESFASVTVNLPIDHQWDNPEEFAKARGQIKTWEALIALHQIVDGQLRAAVGPRRVSRRILLNALEALLIAHGVEYEREVTVSGSHGAANRPDIWIPVAETAIHVRVCRWRWNLRRLSAFIHDNVTAYSNIARRLIFVVYDRFGIHDPTALLSAPTELLANTYEEVRVRVVKH